jgi:ABC-type branched-subunit amino acid transport system substrate-binding protein
VSAPFSGLLGQIAEKNFTNGYEVWQKEVNAAGGIHGRKIVFVKVDNANTAEGAVAACKEASSNGTFMVMIELTGGTESDCYESKKVPAFDLGPRFLKPWKYVIGGGHTPLAAPTEVSFLRSRHMNAQAHKIGMIFSADSIGLSSEAKALTAELRNQGMTLVHTEKIATNQASFVSEMSRMKASGAQTVLLLVGLESAGVIRDSKAVGYTPQWYTGPNSSIDLVAQANTGQLQGVFGTRYVTTTETAAFASYVQKVRRHQGESAARSADTLDAQAYAHGDFLGVILRAAGRSLTRESFLAAAGTIEGYDNGLMGTFTLKGRQVPIAIMELVPLRCCNPNSTYRSLGPPSERF